MSLSRSFTLPTIPWWKWIIAALAVFALFLYADRAEAIEWGKFDYEILDENEVVITGYRGKDDEVVIPAIIDGRQVTKIGEEAFKSNDDIYRVTIPYGVTEIGDRAFYWASVLESVTIPDSVIRIGESAFEYTQLWSVTIPESVTEMGPYAFANIALLGSVTLPGSLAEIPDYAFYECVGLKSVVIPEGVVRIGESAFSFGRLQSVTLPGTLIEIGPDAFSYNYIENLTIPHGVVKIGDYAFSSNEIRNVTIPESVTEIGKGAFGYNYISSVTLPSGLTEIAPSAFVSNSLTGVTIPSGVTKIGESAFQFNDLQSVIIPAGVTVIGEDAFYRNELVSVTLPEGLVEIGGWAFADNEITDIVIPDSVTAIGSHAFYDNELQSVKLPDGLTEIEDGVFEDNLLTSVTIPAGVTRIGEDAFCGNRLQSVTLPDGLVEIGEGAFGDNKLTFVLVPESVEEIGEGAFDDNMLVFVVIENADIIFPDYESSEFFDGSNPVIIGHPGSEAEALADANGYPFMDIGTVGIHPNGGTLSTIQPDVDVVAANGEITHYRWSEDPDVPDLDPASSGWEPFSGTVSVPAETGTYYLFVRAEVPSGPDLPGGVTWIRRSKMYFVDFVKPVITLHGPSVMQVQVGDVFDDPGYTATDNVDGDITPKVIKSGDTVDTSRAGTYTILYDVTDSAGNAAEQKQRVVEVYEVTPPPPPPPPPPTPTPTPPPPSPVDSGTDGSGEGTGEDGTGEETAASPAVERTVEAGEEAALELEDKLVLTVPEGATGETAVITASEAEDLDDLSDALQDGQTLVSSVLVIASDKPETFAKPVTIAIRFDPAKVGENQIVSIFYYDEERKEWVDIGGTVEGEWVKAETDRFGKFAVLAVDVTEPAPAFTDIAGHWGEKAILEAAEKKLITGYPDGTFKPDQAVTRAEFLVMLARALGWGDKSPAGALPFTDADRMGSWAMGAVAAAVEKGIVSGYPDGSFRPDEPISRAEMAVMIARALGAAGNSGDPTAFADDADIPAWAKGAVEALRQLGIVQGREDNRFAPGDTATRAEAAVVLLRMLEKL